jgi:hypothetical protein
MLLLQVKLIGEITIDNRGLVVAWRFYWLFDGKNYQDEEPSPAYWMFGLFGVLAFDICHG